MRNAPATAAAIELAWSEELADRFNVQVAAIGEKIRPWFSYPNDTVRVELMDGSFLELKFAFFVASESRRALAVFTEHSGHFVLPFHEACVYVNGRLAYQQNAA